MDILFQILGFIVTIITAFAVGMLYMGITRTVNARVQNRFGPPLYQNVLDVIKLYSKETNINHGWMQHMGPMFAITASITTLMFVPVLRIPENPTIFNSWFANLTFQGDMIFLIYIMVFGSLGMALGAGQTGNPNSAIGVTRGLSQMAGYEIPFVLAVVALMIDSNTTTVTGIMEAQQGFLGWNLFANPFTFLAGMMAFLGMMSYAPFDIVSAPSEVASGPISEFGGKYLALMMTSRSIFAFGKLVLFVDLFLGGASSIPELLIKTFVLYMIPVLIGVVNPRLRTEQAITFFWKWPSFFGVLAILWAIYL